MSHEVQLFEKPMDCWSFPTKLELNGFPLRRHCLECEHDINFPVNPMLR